MDIKPLIDLEIPFFFPLGPPREVSFYFERILNLEDGSLTSLEVKKKFKEGSVIECIPAGAH